MTAHDTVVVGLGSIGARHARILKEAGRNVATVSRRPDGDFSNLEAALHPEVGYVVIATETTAHAKALAILAERSYNGTVMVEKPIFANACELPLHLPKRLFVGYNLRFHPAVLSLARALEGQRPLAVDARVGQHIATWRPGRDIGATASATVAMGGGVLRDLSHELDLLTWLFGPWQRVAAISGSAPEIGVKTEAFASALMELRGCACVGLHLDYLDNSGIRKFRVNTAQQTFEADLVASTLTINGLVSAFPVARDDTYRAMHAAALAGEGPLCDARHGLDVVALVEAIEQAAADRTWIYA